MNQKLKKNQNNILENKYKNDNKNEIKLFHFFNKWNISNRNIINKIIVYKRKNTDNNNIKKYFNKWKILIEKRNILKKLINANNLNNLQNKSNKEEKSLKNLLEKIIKKEKKENNIYPCFQIWKTLIYQNLNTNKQSIEKKKL